MVDLAPDHRPTTASVPSVVETGDHVPTDPRPAAARSAVETPGREYGLDWLRVIAFAILMAYHTGMYFVPWPWSVKNPRTYDGLTWVMLFFNRWRLPLLFFISGGGVFFNLRSRGVARFASERLRRLLVPLAAGMFLIVPPQIWVERTLAGVRFDSYWQFWGTVFTLVPYPAGNLSWHHLWFLPYILTFSLGGLPLFVFLARPSGRALVERLARLCERPFALYLLALPGVAVAFLLGPRWPVTMNLTSDWANLTSSLLSFLFGFVVCGSARFLALVERRRREFLWVAAGWAVLAFAMRLDALERLSDRSRLLGLSVVDSYFAFTTILALVGWSRARLNRPSALLRRANEAVYPCYVAHQTVTVLLGYAWLGWAAPFPVKFAALLAGTFAGSWVFYEAARRHPLTRVLFGMKA